MKTAPLKKSKSSLSVHSRAVRRAASPTLNVDKSLLNISLPSEPNAPLDTKTRMAKSLTEISLRTNHAGGNGGVGKAKSKKLSTKQRKRKEKAMEMGEAVLERTARKVSESIVKAKAVDHRRAGWDDMNKGIEVPVEAAKNMVVEMRGLVSS
ncbi:Alb1-domain-containing protein [Peziza echinospora]|nr:Alb1-domain-containing protein [Peziza echinospora]